MPALPTNDPPIGPALAAEFRPVHPSPSRNGLGLERKSGRELMWWGRRFALDTPYLATFSGWGELLPVYGEDAMSLPVDVVVIVPPPQFDAEGGGGHSQP